MLSRRAARRARRQPMSAEDAGGHGKVSAARRAAAAPAGPAQVGPAPAPLRLHRLRPQRGAAPPAAGSAGPGRAVRPGPGRAVPFGGRWRAREVAAPPLSARTPSARAGSAGSERGWEREKGPAEG